MSRRLFVKITCILLLPVILLAWYDQSRTFYCVDDGKCVTVWKRLGGKCYIISGKYFGIIVPKISYIKTSNTKYMTLYFSDDLPEKIVVRDQGGQGIKNEYQIKNYLYSSFQIINYSDSLKSIIYQPNAQKFKEVKSNANYIDLDIQENYALDKTGEKLK